MTGNDSECQGTHTVEGDWEVSEENLGRSERDSGWSGGHRKVPVPSGEIQGGS